MDREIELARQRLVLEMVDAIVESRVSMALAYMAFADQRWQDGAENMRDAVEETIFAVRAIALMARMAPPGAPAGTEDTTND